MSSLSVSRSMDSSCLPGELRAVLKSDFFSLRSTGIRTNVLIRTLIRSKAYFHLKLMTSFARPIAETNHVQNAKRDESSFVANISRPFRTPRNPSRSALRDRAEPPTRCQQMASGTYSVLQPWIHARQQISTSSYPKGRRWSNPFNLAKKVFRAIIHAADPIKT